MTYPNVQLVRIKRKIKGISPPVTKRVVICYRISIFWVWTQSTWSTILWFLIRPIEEAG